jgi:hypothetical protein
MLKVQPDGLPAGWPALVGCCARAAGFTAAVTHTDRTAATTIRPDIWTSSTLSIRYYPASPSVTQKCSLLSHHRPSKAGHRRAARGRRIRLPSQRPPDDGDDASASRYREFGRDCAEPAAYGANGHASVLSSSRTVSSIIPMTYVGGLDGLWGMYQWLDRTPKGETKRVSGGVTTTATNG